MSPITGRLNLLLGPIWAVIVAAMIIVVHRLAARVHRRNQSLRPDGITVIREPAKAEFEIVAVHGLGAHPIHTWEGKACNGSHTKQHLLQDLFAKDFPTARILSFGYNSDWLVDAPEKTAQEIGKRLLEKLLKHRGDSQRLPIIFIGHSFGGIVIKEALCASHLVSTLLEDICGIIFLGTPHLGTSLSTAAAFFSRLTGFLGSNTALLISLQSRVSQPSDLEDKFRKVVNDASCQPRIASFYETRPTFIGWLSVGLVVDRPSAAGYAAKVTDMDTNHSGLNKFNTTEDAGYLALKGAINELRVSSLLEQADDHIRKKHYQDERLDIKRLSGDVLSMDQCYINLAIVKQSRTRSSTYDFLKENDSVSRLSLFTQQKVQTPEEQARVQLADIFNERKELNGTTISPRRVLIRGRAGVGKTTLCKKMVHDFVKKELWKSLFDRVLWIPLRNLKQRPGSGYNLKTLFDHEFFRFSNDDTHKDGTRFARELEKALAGDRTLFILDGWDEVAGIDENNDMFGFLRELLSQSRVIITSRPAVLPHGISVDLELETIGFSPAQVDEYITKVHGKNVDELKRFLQTHELVRGLVRIPIQLDAFCYCWDPREDGSHGGRPRTMTTLYEMIQTSLWRKDAVQLGKTTAESVNLASQRFIEEQVKDELSFLEHLAFAGLAADKVEFGIGERNAVHDHLRLSFPLDKNLPRLSFLRTSDPSAKREHRLYHFIHLTFQEYFAARYFVRHWTQRLDMHYVLFRDATNRGLSPVEFIGRHKYDARYDVMWRFVAGLIDGGDQHEPRLTRLFQEIENDPVDFLGPTHQRLIMHCLSEATRLPSEIRRRREDRLLAWVVFECDHLGYSDWVRESELPDQVLCSAFSRAQDKSVLLHSLAFPGRQLSQRIMDIIVGFLKHEDRWTRKHAVHIVGNQPTLTETLQTTLIGLFSDEDFYVNEAASKALGKMPALPGSTIDILLELIRDEKAGWYAAGALSCQSELSDGTLNALLELFNSEDWHTRWSAIHALEGQSSLPESTGAALVGLLKDGHEYVRNRASMVLGRQSTLSETNMTAILKLLDSNDVRVRLNVLDAVGNDAKLSEKLTTAVVRSFKHDNRDVRWRAVWALRKQTQLSDDTTTTLIERFEDVDSDVRWCAAVIAGNQSSLSEKTITALTELLKDKSHNVQRYAAEALGEQSTLPETTLLALIGLCQPEFSALHLSVTETLSKQGMLPGNIPMELLEDDSFCVRDAAAKIVGNQSKMSEKTTDALINLLQDEYWGTRMSAVEALCKQPILQDRTLFAITRMFEDESDAVRKHVVEALSNRLTWMSSKTCISGLVSLLGDESAEVGAAVARALGDQSKLEGATISALVHVFKDKGSEASRRAALAVGNHTHLMDNILEALGLKAMTQSELQAKVEVQPLHHPEYMEALFMSLLRRGFRDQFSLYRCQNLLVVNEPSGLRKASLGNSSLQDAILNGRRHLKGLIGHDLWKPLENEDSA